MADILLVEDKESLRQMLQLTLETGGFSIDEATDGAEARRKLGAGRYPLVITDLKMPRADGLEVLRSAKAADPGYVLDSADGIQHGRRGGSSNEGGRL